MRTYRVTCGGKEYLFNISGYKSLSSLISLSALLFTLPPDEITKIELVAIERVQKE